MGMRMRKPYVEGIATHNGPESCVGPFREGRVRTPEMNDHGKPDSPVVPAKPPNKAPAAEVVEERGRAEGNTDRPHVPDSSAGPGVPNRLGRVRGVARRDKQAQFTALLHHVDVARLWNAPPCSGPPGGPGGAAPPDLAGAVHLVVLVVDLDDQRDQLLVPDRPRRGQPALDLVVRRRRDLQTRVAQDTADPFDTAERFPTLVDEPDYLGSRGSNSRAKKAEAAFRISLASLSSRTSRSNSTIRCESTVEPCKRRRLSTVLRAAWGAIPPADSPRQAATRSNSFPVLVRDSMRRCASAASARSNSEVTGRVTR